MLHFHGNPVTFSFLLIGCCEIDFKTLSWLVRSHVLCWNFMGPRLINAAHFFGTYLEMFSFFVRCGWGVQEGDPWHPRSVRPFPVSGWPTPCRGQEIRWTGSPLTLPKVLPLTFLFTSSWRSIKSISLMEHFKLFLLFFSFLLLFHWFWTCYSIVHYGKSNLGIVSAVCVPSNLLVQTVKVSPRTVLPAHKNRARAIIMTYLPYYSHMSSS